MQKRLPTTSDSELLDAEVALMRSAHERLRKGDPLRALAALSEHARRFSDGQLAAMRDAGRVEALCELRRFGEARERALRFLAEHGSTPYADKVRASCGLASYETGE